MIGFRWWKVLLVAVGALITLFIVVAIGGMLLGQTLPERVSYAYEARFDRPREDIWARLKYPDQSTQVRENANGVRYETSPGDTAGRLILLYERDSLVVSASEFPNASIRTAELLIRDGDGTIIQVETFASLRGAWHRLVFPRMLRRQARERIRDHAHELGEPEPTIRESTPVQLRGRGELYPEQEEDGEVRGPTNAAHNC